MFLLKNYLKLAMVIFLVAFMVIHPNEVFAAAKSGLFTWLNIVVPALLPFFIGSELLMNMGLVRFMGVLLEPIMRPLFNLPGAASFVMAVGFTSGFPIGSVLTAKLRQDRICTRNEAERLMSFTNNASPLFMLGAVAVGMFNNPQLGYLIAGAHYLANITLGLILRFHGRQKIPIKRTANENVLKKAFMELKIANSQKLPLGKLLGDAIRNSVNTILLIGGFVLVFSVIIEVMKITGVTAFLTQVFYFLLKNLGFSMPISSALASGIWEVTLGAKFAVQTGAPLLFQLLAVSFILGWSGICVHAQVASVISHTDIKSGLFIITRFAHGVLSAFYCFLFFRYGSNSIIKVAQPVFRQIIPSLAPNWWQLLIFSTVLFIKIALLLLSIGLLVAIIKQLRIIKYNYP